MNVTDMHEGYLMPQENGSHYDTSWVSISDGKTGMLFYSDIGFSFNASHYTPQDLTRAMHPHELSKRPETILNIDHMMSGVGSNSCGPELLPRYRLSQKEIVFEIRIRPVSI